MFLVWPQMYGSQSSDIKSNLLFHWVALDVSRYIARHLSFCLTAGFPAPAVQWYRGTMLLVPADTLAMLSRGGRHILSFSQFQFGETGTTSRFTCSATSPLGLAEADFSVIGQSYCAGTSIYPFVIHFVFVSGAPGKPAVSSNVTEMVASKYRIEWTTPSYSHVVEHALIYKQVKVNMLMILMGKDDQLLWP